MLESLPQIAVVTKNVSGLKRRSSSGEWIVSQSKGVGVQIPHSELTSFWDIFPFSSKECHYMRPAPTQIPPEFAAPSFTSSEPDKPR